MIYLIWHHKKKKKDQRTKENVDEAKDSDFLLMHLMELQISWTLINSAKTNS